MQNKNELQIWDARNYAFKETTNDTTALKKAINEEGFKKVLQIKVIKMPNGFEL